MQNEFRSRVKGYNEAQIFYALQDIQETLKIYRDEPVNHPYVAKLYREWDALLDEKLARQTKPKRGKH